MELKELAAAFGEEAKLPGLGPDADGVYRVEIDGMTVAFTDEPKTNRLMTWAVVGEFPAEGREEICIRLLKGMFMGAETGGSSFAVNPETGYVYLQRMDELQTMDADRFMSAIDSFVTVLERWRAEISNFRPSEDEKPDGALSGFGNGGFLKV